MERYMQLLSRVSASYEYAYLIYEKEDLIWNR
jgi:hypothetical protein